MIKFLADKYYLILVVIVMYFLFNIILRDQLINYMYKINTNESVTDASAYANADKLRGIISLLLFVCLIFISITSIMLLLVPEGKKISRLLLIVVPVLVALLFFCIMAIGGFVGFWAGLRRIFI